MTTPIVEISALTRIYGHDATEVRLDYTVPTGSTGHTLNAEVGLVDIS